MTKEEFKKEYEKIMMEELTEKDVEKRKVIHQKFIQLKNEYKKSIVNDKENRRKTK